jgi:hypothetical protein
MIAEIQQLWRDHQVARFPKDVAGNEIAGADMVSLDSFTAGCVSDFLGGAGLLELDRVECLIRCRDGLEKVVPTLEGEAKHYFSRLHRMSQLVLQALDK